MTWFEQKQQQAGWYVARSGKHEDVIFECPNCRQRFVFFEGAELRAEHCNRVEKFDGDLRELPPWTISALPSLPNPQEKEFATFESAAPD